MLSKDPLYQRLANLYGHIKLPFGWTLKFSEDTAYSGRWYLQVEDPNGIDNVTGGPLSWRGRKWHLSVHMTDGEIVQTAFKAVLTAMEHEAREQFFYKGWSIFDPHYDIEKLVELRSDPASLKERAPMGEKPADAPTQPGTKPDYSYSPSGRYATYR